VVSSWSGRGEGGRGRIACGRCCPLVLVRIIGASTCVRCSVTRGRLQRAGRLAWVWDRDLGNRPFRFSSSSAWASRGVPTRYTPTWMSGFPLRNCAAGTFQVPSRFHGQFLHIPRRARLDSPQAEILDQIVPSPRLPLCGKILLLGAIGWTFSTERSPSQSVQALFFSRGLCILHPATNLCPALGTLCSARHLRFFPSWWLHAQARKLRLVIKQTSPCWSQVRCLRHADHDDPWARRWSPRITYVLGTKYFVQTEY
jgi:hypothetical protein